MTHHNNAPSATTVVAHATTPGTAERKQYLEQSLSAARTASYELANLSTTKKNAVLLTLATELKTQTATIMAANAKDLAAGKSSGLSNALMDRLRLDETRIAALATAVREIAALPDPIGELIAGRTLPNGLKLSQKRVPLGVVLVIYEARPNVTIDIAALCLKSGNVAILRGGKDALHSNRALGEVVQSVLNKHELPKAAVHVVPYATRALIPELLHAKQYIDIVIPRGGEQLVKLVAQESQIPVVYHDKGICHLYIAADAPPAMAAALAVNAKAQRPGVCNAIETILFHQAFPATAEVLSALQQAGVEIRGDAAICKLAQDKGIAAIVPACEADWSSEYLELIIAAKMVPSTTAAITWINRYGSKHSDGIVTQSLATTEAFTAGVDSACVLINASTRFHDGGCFGMGSEIGTSNQKLHVRGPMGIRDLTSYKYIVQGNGQVRT